MWIDVDCVIWAGYFLSNAKKVVQLSYFCWVELLFFIIMLVLFLVCCRTNVKELWEPYPTYIVEVDT